MESYLMENFDVRPKHSSAEVLERWRNLCGVVRNRKRRFRFTANLSKRFEVAAIRRSNQEKFRIAVLVSKAALKFISSISPSNSSLDEKVRVGGLEVCAAQLVPSNGEGHVPRLRGKYKKHALAVLYLVLEVTSFVLDQVGKSKWGFVLAAFLLSALVFLMCLSSFIMERTTKATRLQDQEQLITWMEIAFSTTQLIVTLFHFIYVDLGKPINNIAELFPLVFAIIGVVYVFKNQRGSTRSSRHTEDDSSGDITAETPLVDSMPSTSSDQQYQLQNIEVHMPEMGAQRTINLRMITCYDDLYKKVEEMFNIEGELLGHNKKWRLVYCDNVHDRDEMININDPWNEFRRAVRKILIHRA